MKLWQKVIPLPQEHSIFNMLVDRFISTVLQKLQMQQIRLPQTMEL
jgi:hypothetical protein